MVELIRNTLALWLYLRCKTIKDEIVSLYRIALTLSMLFFTLCSQAALVDYQKKDNIAYFLYSVPNKVVRYDLVSASYLSEITLNKIPTAFEVKGSDVYVGFHRELRKLALDGNGDDFIRNTSTDIKNIITLDNNIFIEQQDSNVLSLNIDTLALNETRDSWYSGQAFIASNVQGSYYYRTTGVSPSDIHKVTINNDGTTLSDADSSYHGDYPNASQLFLNESENKIYDNAGIIYFAADLTYAGSLAGSVDALGFQGDNAVAARENILHLFNSNHIEQGTITLTHNPFFLVSYQDSIFSFAEMDSGLEVVSTDISAFELPQAGVAQDPEEAIFQTDFFAVDSIDTLYMLDKESLSIFRWSSTTSDYLASWSLINPPTWMTHSKNQNRLYLAYPNGKITYIDTSDDSDGLEVHFTSLPLAVTGLLATGDFLFAADASGAWNTHYTFSDNGTLVDSEDWKHTGSQYAYSALTKRIYHYRDGTSPNDLEWSGLNDETGDLDGDGDSPYHGSTLTVRYPIRVHPGGDLLILGSGQLIDAYDLTVQNSLSNNITDAVWIGDSLVTIAGFEPSIQFWDSNYQLLSVLSFLHLPLSHS